MGRKSVLQPYVLTSINLNSSTATSDETDCANEDSIAYLCSWSANNTAGVLKAQGLILAERNLRSHQAAAIWVDIPMETIAVTGSSDAQIFDIDVRAFVKTRLAWTKNSGSAGTLAITVMGKVVGA